MTILPPLLPELDGGRLAAVSPGLATATIRIGARVVGIAGADALIETAHGRALLQGAPGLRPGAALVLELQRGEPASARTGRVVAVDAQRLEPSPAGTLAARAAAADCPDGARCHGTRGERAPGRPRWPGDRAGFDRAPERAAAGARVGLAPEQPGFVLGRSRLSRQRPARDERPG
jgi:hypothetical protein